MKKMKDTRFDRRKIETCLQLFLLKAEFASNSLSMVLDVVKKICSKKKKQKKTQNNTKNIYVESYRLRDMTRPVYHLFDTKN